jgi:hypothetical protein
MGLIYKLTSPEGKSYIGQTVQSFKKRMNGHVHGKSYCRVLKCAIDEYGFDNFEKQVLWEGENELISEKEKYYIKYFNTMHPNGYNLSSGGGRGEHRCQNTIKLMTENQRKNAKLKNDGLLGYIHENKSKIDGRTTSWTLKTNKCGSLGNFKTEEDAKCFQIEYSRYPQKYLDTYSKKRVPNGEGGVYYRKERNKWIVMPMINGVNTYMGSYDTEEEASNILRKYKLSI